MAEYRTVTVVASVTQNSYNVDGTVSQNSFDVEAQTPGVVIVDPYIEIEQVEDGALVTVTDARGSTEATIYHGVMYTIEPSANVIVYDPNQASGSKLTPSSLTVTSYKTINGTRESFPVDAFSASIYYDGGGSDWESSAVGRITSATIPLTEELGNHGQVIVTARVDNVVISRIEVPVISSADNIQSDWNETDTTDAAFIQNKPNIKAGTGDGSIMVDGIWGVYGAIVFSADANSATLSYRSPNNYFAEMLVTSFEERVEEYLPDNAYLMDDFYNPTFTIKVLSIDTTAKTITLQEPASETSITDAEFYICSTNKASGLHSRAIGIGSVATANIATAIGAGAVASASSSVAVGSFTVASGEYATSEGMHSVASGYVSYAEGYASNASGYASHSEGGGSAASGNYAHAEGYRTTASSYQSHAEGFQTTASGQKAHSEGHKTVASGNFSHSEGYGSVASEQGCHAEGINTTASGQGSHTEGRGTTASGRGTHAEGFGTIANSAFQHVSGEFNIADPVPTTTSARGTYAEIIGNGTADNARSNARTLDWSGNAWFAGDVTDGSRNVLSTVAASVPTEITAVQIAAILQS